MDGLRAAKSGPLSTAQHAAAQASSRRPGRVQHRPGDHGGEDRRYAIDGADHPGGPDAGKDHASLGPSERDADGADAAVADPEARRYHYYHHYHHARRGRRESG